MKNYNIYNKKTLVLMFILIFIVITLPLHIKVIESKPAIDKSGKIEIKYQEGLIAINSDNINGYDYIDFARSENFKIKNINNVNYSSDDAKIKKIYIGLFVRLKDELDIEKNRNNKYLLLKTILECNVYKIYFSNPLI